MSNLLDDYKLKKQARKNFETWSNNPRRQSDYPIAIVHCKAPVLTRVGRGCEHLETEQDTNLAILEYLIENWDSIAPDVLNRLKAKEREALKACQTFIDEMQAMIDNCE